MEDIPESDTCKKRNKETQAIVCPSDLFHWQRDKSLVFINIDRLETCLEEEGEKKFVLKKQLKI